MKKITFFVLIAFLIGISTNVNSQGVAINTDGSAPDGSAMLDVTSTTKGILIPRMTSIERGNISSPAKGLMVYDITLNQVYMNTGTSGTPTWTNISTGQLWTRVGNYTYLTNSSDNVGIGLTSPTGDLHVAYNPADAEAIFGTDIDTYPSGSVVSIGCDNHDAVLYVGQSSTYKGFVDWLYNSIPSNAYFAVGTYGGCGPLVLQHVGGNVGIGITSPSELLHVDGNMRLEDAFYDSNNDPGTGGQILQSTATATDWIDASEISDGDWTISGNNLYSSVSGYVGIGYQTPATKLALLDNLSSTNTVEDVLEISRGSTGTPATGIGTGILFRNEVSNGGYSSSGRISSVMESVAVPNERAGMLFETRIGTSGLVDALYLDPDGNVGIGTTNPSSKLDIVGDIDHDFPETSGNALYASGSTSNALYYIENNNAGNGWGLSAGMNSSFAGSDSYGVYGFNDGTGYGVYGKSYNSSGYGVYGINNSTGNYGYAGGTSYGIYGKYYNGNYGYIGGASYGVYGKLVTTDPGDYAIYGYGTDANGEDGTGYDDSQTLGGVKGYNYWGNPYTFAVAGYSYLYYNRSGGTFGAKSYGTSPPWGCLAYQNSGGTEYGGYFTSYTSGSGKDSDVQINNGIGAWGDLFGADIHGKVYGAFIEGENYAIYSKGTSFHDGLDVHLQKTGNNNTVLYTNVSTDVTVQTSGYASLINGESNIAFNEVFANAVSSETPIVVTVTPVGNSNGVYLAEVSNTGFKVIENNGGKSNVTITYIAIGKRAGYENPQLPREVIDVEYTSKLARGLHNDNDTETDGEGLYYENGKLTVGIHPSTLSDKNRPAMEVVETSMKPEVIEIEDEFTDGKAEEIVSDEQKSDNFQIVTPQEPQFENEQEPIQQETQPKISTPKTKGVTPKKTKPVKREPNFNTSDGGPEK